MSTVGNYQQNDDDYEAITRIVDTNSLLQCPLCKKDFQDPRILCSNGHTFCANCIQVCIHFLRWKSHSSLCRMLYQLMVFLNVQLVKKHVVSQVFKK